MLKIRFRADFKHGVFSLKKLQLKQSNTAIHGGGRRIVCVMKINGFFLKVLQK